MAPVRRYLSASVLALGVAVAVHRRGRRVEAVLFGVFALATFFIAGEEISWGQRVFGWDTPDSLATRNHQEESNLHNIDAVQDALNAVFTAIGFYGSAAVAFLRWSPRRLERAPRWIEACLPPLFLAPAFGAVFAYKLARLVAFPSPRYAVVKTGEWVELCLAAAFAVFAWLSLRRLREQTPTVPG